MIDPFAPGKYFIDGNGLLAERVKLGDLQIVLHYDDIPDSDKTIVKGLPCTTAVRAAIDAAGDLDQEDVNRLARDCLDQGIFTADEVFSRVAKSDMLTRPGASRLARAVRDIIDAG
jgi:hypothetical protein